MYIYIFFLIFVYIPFIISLILGNTAHLMLLRIDMLFYLNAFPLSHSNQQAFLLENVPCNNASCEGAHRMFKVYWELMDLNQIRDAVVATFFDIYEDVSLELSCAFGI